MALNISIDNLIIWCDVQLTSDGAGICLPDLRLDNSTNVGVVFKNKQKKYLVNGVPMEGWFSVDFSLSELANVTLIQGVLSRINRFDESQLQILTVEDVSQKYQPPGLWLNIQHDAFFSQHNLSMRKFVDYASRKVKVDYISSPEVNFLRSISTQFKPRKTKIVFRFLGRDDIEPSTNQTYGLLLKKLTFIKSFASGILVPKSYIWPVDGSLYLQPHTSVALDAHKEGLEVFASDFANDVPFAYNFSYDPVAECLSFIDNGNFSVDGVLSDFPVTPSLAIDCFSHLDGDGSADGIYFQHCNKVPHILFSVLASAKPLVISREGASGDYPGCTDLAYAKAISDGVDILDCPVQMTKDGIPFCLASINLMDGMTVAQSLFSNLTTIIPELQADNGIFSFSLTWSQIQSLKPAISNPEMEYSLFRNPKFRYSGKLLTLSEFLALANNATSVSGVLIGIENASYLAEKQGLSVTDAVLDALSRAGYSNETDKRAMILSSNSSVLKNIKRRSNYELVYEVDENIRDAQNSAVMDIKEFAHSVVMNKDSIFPRNAAYLTGATDVVPKLQASNLSVYVQLFSNEIQSQAWDFFSDPYLEINTFVERAQVNGVITDFPATATRYRRNRCLRLGDKTPPYMNPVEPGSLLQYIYPQPPAEAPNPVLTDSDVIEPPLPSVVKPSTNGTGNNGPAAAAPTSPNGQHKVVLHIFLSTLAILLSTLQPLL
ncbi:hypothetical protein RJ640_000647 [Escallonia rubra]|uniref:glycerophosphodiester phosphodiesterase n=1 Tax=Escallonia rubra TaxID=112253 RepID=A0AA88QV24_9ASTE|nr:hypothetical protein RJ640_000647 [Escallonia rubra]